ncbi:MAG TPA: glycosyltransferase family 2 protein [Chloroflexota bacterium]|nr:glycosyltransferase family 2 protein [Chloroflexota bacterium]
MSTGTPTAAVQGQDEITSGQEANSDGISAIVLALDEARHIVPCLRTLQWTDEQIVVVDSRSTDNIDLELSRKTTAELATQMGARVVERAFDNWASQRNFAIAAARYRWVLFVDVDERVPPELASEIRGVLNRSKRDLDAPAEPVGYWVPRQNMILGRWMRHAGWSPDYQLRLFRTNRGCYDPSRPVHELVQLDGRDAQLRHRLVHHNYVTWRQFWIKQRRYAQMEAQRQYAEGRRAKPHNFLLQPLREFKRRYLGLAGYRAGLLGLQLSLVLAAADFLMYRELWRLGRSGAPPRD